MGGRCVIGVDGGTESLRAGVIDLEAGPLGFASEAYPTRFPNPGWAEQSPADWWRALGVAVPKALAAAGAAPPGGAPPRTAPPSCRGG
ncbi:MAG: hypothetical protein IRY94_10555, partial [Rhodospirillaceae bacterium]|nr:hypothetical protein [Rhodospirillaceae bacterium]